MDCPDDNTILEFVEQRLAPAPREAVAVHLDECRDCRGLIAGISHAKGDADAAEDGDALGRYVLLSTIGAGGMGVVQAAFDRVLDRKVALKFLASDPGEEPARARARLEREAQALAKLAHPNVITVHDVGVLEGEVFVAMELVLGGTLRAWLASGPRAFSEILSVLRQAGEGLAAAHAAGLVHRDFKPENVLVGNDGRVRVTDFGLARPPTEEMDSRDVKAAAPPATLTRTGLRAGTPAYMAPEQRLGHATDARSDIYSYCITLHEAVTGVRPAELPRAKRRLPAWLERVLARGLHEDPERRWPSMRRLLEALARGPLVKRSAVFVALGAVALAMLPALAIAHRNKAPPLCQPDDAAFAGVWDDALRSSVHSAFRAAHPSHADRAYEDVDESLRMFQSRWTTMRAESCVATRVHHEQSEMLLDLRTACLDAKRRQAAALVQVFVKADRWVVEKASSAAANVSSVDECANVHALEATEPPPTEPARRRAVEEGFAQLATATALHEAGREADGLAVLEPALDAVRAAAYAPLEAKLLVVRGELLWELARPQPEVEVALHEAARKSIEARDDAAAAEAWTLLAYQTRFQGEGRLWSAYAESAIERLGGDPYLEAERSATLATIESDDGHYDQARALFERARRLFERTRGPSYYRVGRCDDGLGNIALFEQRVDEAYRLHHQARELRARVLGPDHEATVSSMYNEQADLLAEGKLDEALALLHDVDAALDRRGSTRKGYLWQSFADVMRKKGAPAAALAYDRAALDAYADEHGPVGTLVGSCMAGEGVDLIALGRPAEAIAPLETSLKLLETSTSPERSIPLFALARALDMTGRDRRAVSLAEQAESVLTPFAERYGGQYAKDLEQIRAWRKARE
jgi:serine/threonine protein kinase/tetratricopeptide (TPR) repeat protein